MTVLAFGQHKDAREESSREEADDNILGEITAVASAPTTKPIIFEGIHRHEAWNVYCIQLYTETKDYKFQIRDRIGISMHANRHVAAHEFIIEDPVGPSNHQQLFRPPPVSGAPMSPEREAFANRFLAWQASPLRLKPRDGATECSSFLSVTLEDFSNPAPPNGSCLGLKNPPNTNTDTGSPLYELEIFENDIVIVEFVAPPSNPDHIFPPERGFEVLNFDEGLVSDNAEEDYSPETMQRPPTMCAIGARHLELPGHFVNHACGPSSTAYDFFYPTQCCYEPDDLAAVAVAVAASDSKTATATATATARPSWIQAEIRARHEGREKNDPCDRMKARRAVAPGEEITTDYVRWHWSNGDVVPTSDSQRTPIGYFFGTTTDEQRCSRHGTRQQAGKEADAVAVVVDSKRWKWDDLPSKVQWAGRVLGYTKELWNHANAKTPPVFEKKWKHLTAQEREAVVRLTGHTEATWDCNKRDYYKNQMDGTGHGEDDASVSSSSTATSIDDLDWEELSENQRLAATFLGYTETTWNNDEELSTLDDDTPYFYFRPEVRDALAVLGETESTWENDENNDGEFGGSEPWFYCECGSPDCHSSKEKGGFRGTKYLSLEEQMHLGPVSEPWVQQQLQWKFYQLRQQQQQQQQDEKKTEEE